MTVTNIVFSSVLDGVHFRSGGGGGRDTILSKAGGRGMKVFCFFFLRRINQSVIITCSIIVKKSVHRGGGDRVLLRNQKANVEEIIQLV